LANQTKKPSPQLALPAPPAVSKKKKPAKPKKKAGKKLNTAGQQNRQPPLPPPLPSEPGSAPGSPNFSNTTEPRPGEPLPPEAERVLHAVPDSIGDAGEASSIHEAEPELMADDIADLIPEIDFDQREVQDALEEAFDWMAERFDSGHWKLTERQSRMLGKPTTQLLSTVWSKLAQFLPGFLAKLCQSTPGLAGFILAGAVVVGPKAARQIAISRSRRAKKTTIDGERPTSRPGPVPITQAPGPVGAATTEIVEPLPFLDE